MTDIHTRAGTALIAAIRTFGSKRVAASPALAAAREEVKAELNRARLVARRVRDGVALIRFSSPAQIHPLVAQQWRGRLKGHVVPADNTGYRPGWVHFAVRAADDRDLVGFLAEHRPPGADEMYGSGHPLATGGALRPAAWNGFVAGLGFPDAGTPT